MKNYLKIMIITGSIMIGIYGCSNQSKLSDSNNKTEVLTEETTVTENSDMEDNTVEIKDYVHGEDGYYSLIDEGYGTKVKTQIEGTCWVYAASTSMESAYKMEYGEDIDIDPLSILESVYGPEKEEGYFVKEGIDGQEIGGWAWQIVETLSNGLSEYTLVEAENYDGKSIDEWKEQIKIKGGMNVAVNDAKAALFATKGGYKTLNDPDSDDFDHEVVIVGWDDNFPKEFFAKEPSQNGAWLAQNTRGESWGNDGYYWISYDTPFREQTIFRLSKDYSEVVSYDGGNENRISGDETITVANKFHKNGILKAVGTYTTEDNQYLKIEIYDENFKEVLFTQEEQIQYPGYHTIKLNEELNLSDYAISITYSNSAPVEGESWEDSWITYSVGIEKGESFVLVDGEWLDMSDKDTLEVLNLDYEPNNCCIKAIY